MRSAGLRSTQRVDLSHHLFTVATGPFEAEVAAAELWSLGAVGIEETDRGLRVAFIDAALAARARDRWAPRAPIEAFDDHFGLDGSRDRLKGVEAGRFFVHPPWIVPPDDMISVEIDPGHAFGSGSHPSTQLALQLLGGLEEFGRTGVGDVSVLDLGCGTGVLSIAAARLGATVVALDTDPAAITATRANATANDVSDAITTELGSIAMLDRHRRADIVLVNVTIDIHEQLATQLRWRPTVLIAAGILAGGQSDRCAAAWRMRVTTESVDGEWVGLTLAP